MSGNVARFHLRNRVGMRSPLAAFALAAIVTMSSTVFAQGAPRPEQLIKWRQSAFQVIAWNTQRLKVALATNGDAREVQSAANALAAVASSGLPDLFTPGTAHGKGWRETTASEAVLKDGAA